eukprot:6190041-Lingulodinium_polyedra.AAC.1
MGCGGKGQAWHFVQAGRALPLRLADRQGRACVRERAGRGHASPAAVQCRPSAQAHAPGRRAGPVRP